MTERKLDKLAVNFNLERALSSWQKWPDGKDQIQKMGSEIAGLNGSLVLSIRKDKIKISSESFIEPGVVSAFGREEGEMIIFDSESGINIRTSEVANKGLLFLEKGGQRVGVLRPDCISEIKIN